MIGALVVTLALAADPVTQLVDEGGLEAIGSGVVAGGTAGFLASATVLSAARVDKIDEVPWLVLSPPAGAVLGGAAAFGAVTLFHPGAGRVALISSTTWTGAAEGFLLQLAVFSSSNAISAVPLRFATVLGGGAAGLVVGVGLSTLLDPSTGDVALANSALLWGGVLTGFVVDVVAQSGAHVTAEPVAFALIGGSLVPYIAVLASHDVLDASVRIGRAQSWLIEAGGGAGLLSGALFAAVLSASGAPPALSVGAAGVVTAAGVVVGVTGAVLLSDTMRTSANGDVHASPTAFVDDKGNAAPGVMIAGTF